MIIIVSLFRYYTKGSTATLSNFTDPAVLNSLTSMLRQVKEVGVKVVPDTPLWLGETSSTYGGGTPNISDSYANGFM